MLVLRTMVHMHFILVYTIPAILCAKWIILILSGLHWCCKKVAGRIMRVFFIIEIGICGLLMCVVGWVFGVLLLIFIQWLSILYNACCHRLQWYRSSVASVGLIRLQCLYLFFQNADFLCLLLHLNCILLFFFIKHLWHLLRLLEILLLKLLNIVSLLRQFCLASLPPFTLGLVSLLVL